MAELNELRCSCGATENLIFRDNRWWCSNCIWTEVLRLRAKISQSQVAKNDRIAENIITSYAGNHQNPAPYRLPQGKVQDTLHAVIRAAIPLTKGHIMGKLNGSRCYLSGAMEVCVDSGIEWRQTITPFLKDLGVTVLDPTDKPTDIIKETPERWKFLRQTDQYDILRKEMKLLRCVDLRMVDVSDFIIVNMDNNIRTTGTWEEIFLANRQKKPIIFRIKQGKRAFPLWLFGTVPHEMVFGEWNEMKEYLYTVDKGNALHLRRWLLFNF